MGTEKGRRQKATVGRVVHYVSYGSAPDEDGEQAFPSECRAAVVTEVPREDSSLGRYDTIGLCAINPTGFFFHPLEHGGVMYSDDHVGGTWHWPEGES